MNGDACIQCGFRDTKGAGRAGWETMQQRAWWDFQAWLNSFECSMFRGNGFGEAQMDFNSLGLLVLRLGLGGTMAFHHGLAKVLAFSKKMHTFPDPFNIGSVFSLTLTTFAELVCALAIIIGIFTRLATLPLIVVMAVAFFMIHGADTFNVKELALVYLIGFSTLLCTGAGAFSADAIFRKVK